MIKKEETIQDEANYNSPLGVGGRFIIKICGMKFPDNIEAIAALKPDFIGFIFYPKSPRFAESLDALTLKKLPSTIKKIGVFVNENLENILTVAYTYKLDGIQLHGTELVDMCKELKSAGYIVIKAFPIAEAYNFKVTKEYEGVCDYFLFDTKTDAFGGSGLKFNWSMLEEYVGETPFLLSGGIAVDDAEAILKIEHPKFAGIDLNSKFEQKPALKDVYKLKTFMTELKQSKAKNNIHE